MIALVRYIILLVLVLFGFQTNAQSYWNIANEASSINYEQALDVAVDDANGYYYVVGVWDGALDGTFGAGSGPTDFTSTYGGEDGFIAKYDLLGNLQWAFKVGGPNDDAITGVAVDASGNIYVTGYFEGAAEYDGVVLNGITSVTTPFAGKDIVEASYNANGELRWMWEDGGTGLDEGTEVAVNANGVFFTGKYSGTAEIGGYNTLSSAGGTEIYVVKRSLTGNTQWMIDGASNADDSGNDIVADNNYVYLIGDFNGTNINYTDWGFTPSSTISNASAGTSDITLLCIDENAGTFLWHSSIGSTLDDFGNGITLDASGFYCTGATNVNPTFPGLGVVGGQTGQDVFISGHNLNTGDANWAVSEVGNASDVGYAIDADQNGNVVMAGALWGATNFSSNIKTSLGANDVFVASYTNAGAINWVNSAGDNDKDLAYGVATYQTDRAYVVGMFEHEIDFPPLPTITSDVSQNIFHAEIRAGVGAAPVWCWAEDVLGVGNEEFLDIATDPTTGTSYAVGYFTGDLSADFPTGVNNTPDMSGPQGNQDGLIAKYDASGNPVWAFRIGKTGESVWVTGVEIGAGGNIFITGYFNDRCDFDGTNGSGSSSLTAAPNTDEEVFLASYDSDGQLRWVIQGSNTGEAMASDIAVNGTNVYITGWYENTITFDGGTATTANDNVDVFVVAYDQNTGTHVWESFAGDNVPLFAVDDRGYAIAADNNGVYVTGTFSRTLEFDGGPTTVTGSLLGVESIFIAEYDQASGAVTWASAISGNLNCIARGIAVDPNYIYVAGGIQGTISLPLFGPTIAVGGVGQELFACGIFRGTKVTDWVDITLNNSAVDVAAEDVVSDGVGNLYVTGPFIGTTDFNGGADSKTAVGNNDAFVIKYKDSGTYMWGQVATDNDDVIGRGVAYDNLGGVYVAGMMTSQGTFTPQPVLGDATGDEAFIAKLNCVTCDASFTYASSSYCGSDVDPTPVITGDAGGIFTAPSGVVFVSTATGEIDLSASTVGGPYTITYTSPSICTESFSITISADEDPSFTYSASTYCQNAADPIPTITGTGGGTFSGPAGVVFISTSTGQIDLSASTVGGPYNITYTTPGPTCPGSTTFAVTINAEEDPAFSYPAASYCQDVSNPVATITGTGGGSFSGPAGIVFVNTSTGEINLSASTAGGPYNITYTTPGPTCANSTTFAVTINATEDPAFSYAASSYCQNAADPIPTITGTGGGTFSGPAGVVFISTSTGQIDLSASTVGGPYNISYTTPGPTCPSSTVFAVSINVEDDPAFSYGASSYCQFATDPIPTITGTGGGTFTEGSGNINFVNTTTGEIDLSASTVGGPFTITYTTPGPACPNSTTFDVTITALDDASFSYPAASYCQNDANPTPTITGIGGGTFSGPANVVFVSTATGEIDLGASTAGGPYTITYTTGGACSAAQTFDVTISAEDDPSFTYTASSYCQGDANPLAGITGTGGGTFSGPAGIVFVNTSTGEIDLAASTVGGPYNITYTTAGPTCPNSTTFAITINAEDDPSFTYSAASYCQNDADPAATITGTGGGIFSGPAGVVFVNTSTGEIDLSASTAGGPYNITYTTAGPTCPNSTTFAITINAEDDPSFSYGASSYCQGDANPLAGIMGTGGGTFSGPAGIVFVNTSTGEIDLAASTVGGPYNITYTTAGPTCPNSTTFAITINAEDDPSFTYSAASYCQNDADPAATITGTGGGIFSGPAGVVFVNTSTGEIDLSASTAGGPYNITYTTSGTCSNSATFAITINTEDDPSFSYGASSYCLLGTDPAAAITGTVGGTFSEGSGNIVFLDVNTGLIDVSASTVGGPYTITYTTPGPGCPNSTTFSISISAMDDPSFNYSAATYCQGEADPTPTITGLTGGTFSGPAGIVFVNTSTGEIDLSASAVGGPHAVTYTTAGPCPSSTTFNITINADDAATIAYPSANYCQSQSNPTPTITGAGGGTFSSVVGISFVSTATGEIDLGSSTIGGPYTITYTTAGTCPTNTTFDITILPTLNPTFWIPDTICFGSAIINMSDSTVLGAGETHYFYSFGTNGGAVLSGNDDEILEPVASGEGTFGITHVVDNGACVDSATHIITILPDFDASFTTQDTICEADGQFNLNTLFTNNTDTGGYWTGTGVSNDSILDPSGLDGTYAISYIVGLGNCVDTFSGDIVVIPTANPSWTAPASICKGGGPIDLSILITGMGNGTFSGAGVSGNSFDPVAVGAGNHNITYTVGTSPCEASMTHTITVLDDPIADAGLDDDVCGLEYQLDGSSNIGTGESWTDLNGAIYSDNTDPAATVTSQSYGAHTFYLTASQQGVCLHVDSVVITFFEQPVANAGPDQVLESSLETNLAAITPSVGVGEWSTSSPAYIWDLNDEGSLVQQLVVGSNVFEWTVTNGPCPAATDEVIITVSDLSIPEAVTPNYDGQNDFFEIIGLVGENNAIQIFNRWGQLVYESSNYQNDWDGSDNSGSTLPNDTYFYILNLNNNTSYNGYVVLKR